MAALLAISCAGRVNVSGTVDSLPEIFPDYRDVTVPENIAPLDFSYLGTGKCVLTANGKTIRSRKGGLFVFKKSLWRKWMKEGSVQMTLIVKQNGSWVSYKPFNIIVSRDRIDPWFSYRLIPPGYQGWQEMGIYQRNLENYTQEAILSNDLTGGNCMNCHTFRAGDPSKMVFHARATFGGTVVVNNGEVEKLNTKTDSTISALVYPYWHPSGDYVAFSVNKTFQSFHNHDENRIEVYDLASDVVVYNVKTHQIAWSPLTKSEDYFETFPTFSPDGKWLYYLTAKRQLYPTDYDQERYNLCRVAFDEQTGRFGQQVDTLIHADQMGKSVTWPRPSYDGKYIMYTLADYGYFSIWHSEADLWLLDLQTGATQPINEVNSAESESFHNWSSNSKWAVVASRRDDGVYTRLYLAHMNEDGRFEKAFLLPQRNPVKYYSELIYSYNTPDFTSGKVQLDRHSVRKMVMSSNRQGVSLETK